MKKNILTGSIIAVLALILLGSVFLQAKEGGTITNAETIKIGALVSLTGNLSTLGEDTLNGLEVAKEKLKTEGINVEIIYEDAGTDPKKALPAAIKLVEVNKVPIIIAGPGSSANLAVAPQMEETGTLFVAISSTPKLNTAGKNIFKLQPDIDAEIDKMIHLLKERNIKSLAIMYDTSSDTHTLGKSYLAEKYEKSGGRVEIQGFDGKASSDYRTQLLKLKNTDAEALYVLATDKGGGIIVRQAGEMGMTIPVFSWSGLSSEEFFKGAGKYSNGVIITDQVFSCGGTAAMKEYCALYEKKYPDRKPLKYGAHAYDTLKIIADAVKADKAESAEETKVAVANALTNKTYSGGASGDLSFNTEGNTVEQEFEFRVSKDSEFVGL